MKLKSTSATTAVVNVKVTSRLLCAATVFPLPFQLKDTPEGNVEVVIVRAVVAVSPLLVRVMVLVCVAPLSNVPQFRFPVVVSPAGTGICTCPVEGMVK